MIKRMLLYAALLAAVCLPAAAQYTTITGGNVQDASGAKLVAGQICFLATDSNDNPINFQAGGGGQVVKRAKCASITNGVIGSLQVATPASTSPTGISYRVTVKDSLTNQELIHYTGVQPTSTTWSFDACACSMFTTLPLPTPASTTGNFTVNGNLTVTGSFSLGAFTATTVTASSSIAAPTVTASSSMTTPSLSIGGGTALTTSNSTGSGNLVKQTSASLTTPDIGAATGASLALSGSLSSKDQIVNQNANGDEAIQVVRKTDSSPTGNAFAVRNSSNTSDVASISTTGFGNFATVTTANVVANQTPSSAWTINAANSNALITLANNATYDLAAGSGIIAIHRTTGQLGLFVCAGGICYVVSDGQSVYSITSGTSTKVNLFYNGSTAYRIENKTGGSVTFFVTMIETRDAT
jgi:hypothetical protein